MEADSLLRKLAEKHVLLNQDDWKEAGSAMAKEVHALLSSPKTDPKLKKATLNECISLACMDHVNSEGQRIRAALWHDHEKDAINTAQEKGKLCKPGEQAKPKGLKLLAFKGTTSNWMYYVLEAGKFLGDYTYPELDKVAVKYINNGNARITRGTFVQAVSKVMKKYGARVKVKSKMTSIQLGALADKVKLLEKVG